MANPQTEDGYTKIANELLEAMCLLHLSGNQWKVLHTVIRKTYGWNKKADWITSTQIAEATGVHRCHVSAALKTLAERGIIIRDGRYISIQKDYEQWQTGNLYIHDFVTKNGNKSKRRSVPESVTECTDIGNKSVPILVHTKERKQTIQKKKRSTGTSHSEAIEKFRGITGRYPNHVQITTIDARVTDLTLWFECIYEWNLRGYNPTNVKGMLDWYAKGGPPVSGPKGNNTVKQSFDNIDAAIAEIDAQEVRHANG